MWIRWIRIRNTAYDNGCFQQGDVEHGEHQAVPQQGEDGAYLRGLEEGAW